MKRNLTLALAAAATFAAASPAQAGVVLVGTPGGTMNAGQSASINFNTAIGGTPVITIPGLTSTLTLQFINSVLSSGITTFNFNYSVANTSTISGGSRLSVLGFKVDPNATGASVSGVFNSVGSGNVPNYGTAEVCVKSGGGTNNCAGGGNGGVLAGQVAGGALAIRFNGAVNNITLSDFVVRYQSFNYQGIGSGIGLSVPEPGTWMLMIAGVGLIGWQLRRRRQTVKLTYA